MIEISAKVVMVMEDNSAGIGIEVYNASIHDYYVHYIASLWIDHEIKKADGMRIAVEHLREAYGPDTLIKLKTPHMIARRLEIEGVVLRNTNRASSYADTTILADDAIKRQTSITELL